VRVVVGEGAQPVEFFLPGGVPEGELDVHVVDEDVVDVVFEDGWFAAIALAACSARCDALLRKEGNVTKQ